jgi:hypothetical protein
MVQRTYVWNMASARGIDSTELHIFSPVKRWLHETVIGLLWTGILKNAMEFVKDAQTVVAVILSY